MKINIRKCWGIFNHDWSVWMNVTWGKDKKAINTDEFGHPFLAQTRDCLKCKMTQIRRSVAE